MTDRVIQSILIDNREPLWMQNIAIDGAPTVVTQLQCGDMWLATHDEKLLIVERKTADDLLASIADGRLFDQAAAMTAMTPWVYIVVQGELIPAPNGRTIAAGRTTGWRWSAVQGALQTVQEMGIAVVYLSEAQIDFHDYIIRLANRDRSVVRVGATRKPELLAPGMLLLMALPDVGPDRAKMLLEQTGSAAFALSAMTDDMLNIIGIGAETRAKARAALGLTDGARLEIVSA